MKRQQSLELKARDVLSQCHAGACQSFAFLLSAAEGCSGLLGAFADGHDAPADLLGNGTLLLGGSGDLMVHAVDPLDHGDDRAYRVTGLGNAGHRLRTGVLAALHMLRGLIGNFLQTGDQPLNL